MRNVIKWSLTVIALCAVCPRVFLWSMNRRQHMIQDALSAMGTTRADLAVDPLARTVTFVVAPDVTTVAVTAAALVWTATIGAVTVAVIARRMIWFSTMRTTGPVAPRVRGWYARVMVRAGIAALTLVPVVALAAWTEIRAAALLDAAAMCNCSISALTAPAAATVTQRVTQGVRYAWAARHTVLSIATLAAMTLLWNRAGLYANRIRFEWRRSATQ
jgi:hypothetical protein